MEGSGMCANCNSHDGRYCPCPHHMILPGVVLLIALVFLLKALGIVSVQFADLAWPILLGIAMLVKLGSGKCKCYGHKM